jgi:glycosyltransferase involved in cell wall biosynthesis
MKVLSIHHGRVVGGAPTSLLHVMRQFDQDPDLDVTIACVHPEMEDFFKDRLDRVAVMDWSATSTFIGRMLIGWTPLSFGILKPLAKDILTLIPNVREEARRIKAFQPDLVHLNSSVLLSSLIACRLVGVPVVVHNRECFGGGVWNLRRRFAGKLMRGLATQTVAISPVEEIRMGGQDDPSVTVVFNPIDFDVMTPDGRDPKAEKRALGIDEDKTLIISLGGAVARKGCAEIVAAAKHLPDEIQLLVAGPVPAKPSGSIGAKLALWSEDVALKLGLKRTYSAAYGDRLARLLAELPENKVLFSGVLTDVVPLIAASDAVVFAGTVPHFPRPAYEAWAMNTAVIVFDVDGVKQNVVPDQDGLIVPLGNVDALASAMLALHNDPQQRQAFGKSGHQKARERTLRAKSAAGLKQVWQAAIGHRP